VADGFEPVRAAFIDNLTQRGELGAACCVYRHDEKVVDLGGGIRDMATGAPCQEDTMVLVYSATKGLAAMTMAVARSRGWLDYDARACSYWPELAQAGKGQGHDAPAPGASCRPVRPNGIAATQQTDNECHELPKI
jgi:CubicO group peptidase (beta-lactamase class C family)